MSSSRHWMAHAAEQHQDQSYDEHDDADGQKNRQAGDEETDNDEADADNDHGPLSTQCR